MQPGEAIIHALPQEFIIDSEPGIKNPVGMSGMRLEANYHIITGQIAAINNVIKCVKKAGLEVANLTLEPLASAASVLSEDEKEAGVALIDIGGGTTDIAIFQEGIIRHTAVIPFGGDIITKDIKEGCNIIQAQAELLKVKFGSALAIENQDNEIVSIPGLRGREPKEISLKNLANIIQARLEEIIEHAVYEIRNSGFEKKLIAGIVLTGGGSQMRHLVQLTEYISGMDVRIGYPTEHLAGNFDEVKSPMYATGIGLVITESDDMLNRKRSKTENHKQSEASTAAKPDEETEESQSEENETDIPPDEKPNLFERFKKWFGEDIQ
jgi:cell division protein FtsA